MLLEVKIRKKLKEFTLDVDFVVKDAVLGLMGSSGSGKSMTLKCIAGIEKPDEGRIVLDGRVLFDSQQGISLKPQQRHIGYMFQSYALFPNMTVKQNILCGLEVRGLSASRQEQCLQELLTRFQLQAIAESYPRQISGGQKQRAALARMLGAAPQVILLDEPFSALDTGLKQELRQELQELLQERGGVTILVSHDKQEIELLSASHRKIEQGRFVAYE